MFKRRKLVMLPSNNKSDFKVGDIGLHPVQGLFINKNPNLDKVANYTKQYLYIIYNDEIKDGDWCIDTVDNNFIFRITNSFIKDNPNYKDYCEKIIATNDNSLKLKVVNKNYSKPIDSHIPDKYKNIHLPEPSHSFIEAFVKEFNKGNIITDVLIEYETTKSDVFYNNYVPYDSLKINTKDNTVTIKKVKDSWNKEEVISLCRSAANNHVEVITNEDKWIEENL